MYQNHQSTSPILAFSVVHLLIYLRFRFLSIKSVVMKWIKYNKLKKLISNTKTQSSLTIVSLVIEQFVRNLVE